jgi:hypothetical protein
VSSKAGKDSLSSHVDAVVAKKTMSEFGDFGTPRSNLTGFTGVCHSLLTAGSRRCCCKHVHLQHVGQRLRCVMCGNAQSEWP